MAEASRNNSIRRINAESVLKIFRDCGLGPTEVTPRVRILADLLSLGRENKQVTGTELQRSKGAYSVATKLLDYIEQEMKWNSQLARENPQLHDACQAEHRKLQAAADGITGLNETELLRRAAWASQKPRLRMRNLVASHVFSILAESGCENLTFPNTEDARVIKVTTKLLQATVEPGANEVTVRQTVKRLTHRKPARTQKP